MRSSINLVAMLTCHVCSAKRSLDCAMFSSSCLYDAAAQMQYCLQEMDQRALTAGQAISTLNKATSSSAGLEVCLTVTPCQLYLAEQHFLPHVSAGSARTLRGAVSGESSTHNCLGGSSYSVWVQASAWLYSCA